jgi:endonuclease III related protein
MDDPKLKKQFKDIYRRLYKVYGPQHWWPAEERLEMIIGQILTQSAAWTNVEKALTNLKEADALSFKALRDLPQEEVAGLVFPSGYFNVKARKLKAMAEWLGQKYKDDLDKLFSQDINKLRGKLLDVYGIGEESADSIILYAGFKPIFVIDAYTRRIFGRLGMVPVPKAYKDFQKLFMENLPPDVALFNEYHALLVRLGNEICRKKPLCPKCCLKTVCSEAKKPH